MNDGTVLKKAAEQLIASRFIKFFDSWLASASKQEKKGLKILHSIFNTQGKKRFQSKVPKNENSLRISLDHLRKKQMRTSYDVQFCDGSPDLHEPEIFKYKSINDFHYSQVLTQNAREYLNAWLELKDDPGYKSSILRFLKSFFSVYKVQAGFLTSTHRESFQWVEGEKTGNRVKSCTKGIEEKGHKRTLSLQIQTDKILPKLDRGYKLKAQQGLMGNGKITAWVSNLRGKDASLYQDSYIPLVHNRVFARRADFNTSIVCRLLPNS